MNLVELVRDALAENVCLELSSRSRKFLVEVHAIGRLLDGSVVLRVWQREMPNSCEMGISGWNLLHGDTIETATLTSVRSLAPRLGYRRNDPDLGEVLQQF